MNQGFFFPQLRCKDKIHFSKKKIIFAKNLNFFSKNFYNIDYE